MNIDYGGSSGSVVAFEPKDKDSDDKSTEEKELFQGLINSLPPMPGELGTIAKNHWVFIGVQLKNAGLITKVDLSVLRVYCETYEHYVKSQRECVAKDEWQPTPNGYSQLAPWAIARERHASRLHKLEAKLFLTPHARQSIKLTNPNQDLLDLD